MSEISVYVLKSFLFSRDGIHEESAAARTTIDIPARLFDGLNREGYVRRETIGDGHISLHPEQAGSDQNVNIVTAPNPAPPVSADPVAADPAVESDDSATVVEPAPQPPAATADLTEDELAALADGSWKDWRFFKQRSVAAKISTLPIKDGADAKAAIEAFIAPQGDL